MLPQFFISLSTCWLYTSCICIFSFLYDFRFVHYFIFRSFFCWTRNNFNYSTATRLMYMQEFLHISHVIDGLARWLHESHRIIYNFGAHFYENVSCKHIQYLLASFSLARTLHRVFFLKLKKLLCLVLAWLQKKKKFNYDKVPCRPNKARLNGWHLDSFTHIS